MTAGPLPYPWPTPDQTDLLRVILAPEAEARAAWAAWSGRVDFEALDQESNFLLPAASRALPRLGLGPQAWLGRMRGFHRRAWVRNQQILARAAATVRGLTALLGQPPVLLKGAALICRGTYADAGLRVLLDHDLLVPEARAGESMRWLQQQGWQPRGALAGLASEVDTLPARWRRFFHAQDFLHPDGLALDLHWHLLPELAYPGSADGFLARAEPGRLPDGTPVRWPAPTDLLLHLLLHGARWLPVAPARWVCDVVLLLRSEGERMDWQLFRAEARRCHCTLRLAATLEWLVATFPAEVIPAGLGEELRRAVPAPGEQAEFDKRMSPPSGDPGLPVGQTFALYRARSGPLSPRLLLELLANRWQLPHVSQVPLHALKAALQRGWRRLSRSG